VVKVFIDDCCYSMNIGCGLGTWTISGNVHGHPDFRPGEFIYPDTPISYNVDDDIFVTESGKEYHIICYKGNKEEFATQILKDISNYRYGKH
jgi:hypothetical protein